MADDCGARPKRYQPVEEPEPVRIVNWVIFDGGIAWDAQVSFFEEPDPKVFIAETVELAYSIVQEAIAVANSAN